MITSEHIRDPLRADSRKLALFLFGVLILPAETISAPRANWYLTASTDYVYRGLSRSDGEVAVSGGIDREYDRLFGGVWASTLTFPGDPGFAENVEIVPYIGMKWLQAGDWRLDTLVASHVLDGSSDLIAGSFTEYSVSVAFRESVGFEITHIPNALGTRASATYVEAQWSRRLAGAWSFDWNAGFAHTSRALSENYLFGDLGVTRSWSRVSLDLRLHWADDRARDAVGDLADSRVVLSLTFTQ